LFLQFVFDPHQAYAHVVLGQAGAVAYLFVLIALKVHCDDSAVGFGQLVDEFV
jgi:hypothetical protein